MAVLSPEKTILTFRLAGLGSRVVAGVVDYILMLLIAVGMSWGLALLLHVVDEGLAIGVAALASVATLFLYFILFEGLWNGLTPGKRAAGIRVRMADGTPLTFGAAFTRNILRPADMLPGPYFLGLLAIFTNPRAQRIGDLVAHTIVCQEIVPRLESAPAPHTAGIHPMEDRVGSLRGMSLKEYVALRRLADRFPELTPETQSRLVSEVWLPFAERRKVPEVPGVHPIYLIEAVVMKYGREHGML